MRDLLAPTRVALDDLPLLYVAGASVAGEPVHFPVEGIDGGSVSMLTVQLG